jgi:tRNA(adenine34) deaminase
MRSLPLTQKPLNEYFELLMDEALKEAEDAKSRGEVPIGAVVALDDRIIGRGSNRVEELQDQTAHAELLAMREASSILSNWRLSSTTLCVTVEPCTMCIGAALLSRVTTLVFGVREPKTGAVGSRYDLTLKNNGVRGLRVVESVRAKESAKLLRDFFQARRGH